MSWRSFLVAFVPLCVAAAIAAAFFPRGSALPPLAGEHKSNHPDESDSSGGPIDPNSTGGAPRSPRN